jgi:hypothetical protein
MCGVDASMDAPHNEEPRTVADGEPVAERPALDCYSNQRKA